MLVTTILQETINVHTREHCKNTRSRVQRSSRCSTRRRVAASIGQRCLPYSTLRAAISSSQNSVGASYSRHQKENGSIAILQTVQ